MCKVSYFNLPIGILWLILMLVSSNIYAQSCDERLSARHPIVTATNGIKYESRLYYTIINTQDTDTFQYLKRPCGALLIDEKDLHQWRVETKDLEAIRIDGIDYVNIKDIPNSSYKIFESSQTIVLDIDPWRFTLSEFNLRPFNTIETTESIYGLHLLGRVALRGDEFGDIDNSSLSLQLKGYTPFGRLDSTWVAAKFDDNLSISRGRTTFSHYLDDRTELLELGDVTASANSAYAGYSIGGIQLRRNFASRPHLVLNPMIHKHLLAETPSRLVITDTELQSTLDQNPELANLYHTLFYRRNRFVIPPGPIAITNLTSTGTGEYRYATEDAYGNKQEFFEPYYINSHLLRPKLWDYNLSVGYIRRGEHIHEYQDLIAAGETKYGINNYFSIGGGIAFNEDEYAAGITGYFSIPYVGALITTGAQSLVNSTSNGDRLTGTTLQASLVNQYSFLSYGANWRYTSPHFSQPYTLAPSRDNKHQRGINLGIPLEHSQSLSLIYNETVSRVSDYRNTITVNYQTGFIPGFQFGLELGRTINPTASTNIRLTLNGTFASAWRLVSSNSSAGSTWDESTLFNPQKTSVNITSSRSNDSKLRSTATVTTNANYNSHHYGLTASQALTSNAQPRIGAYYSNPYMSANTSATLNNEDDLVNHQTSLRSGLFISSAGLSVAPTFSTASAILRLGEHGKYIKVRGRKADSNGDLLVTGLTPYRANTITLQLEELPFNKRIRDKKLVVVPDGVGLTEVFISVDEITQALVSVMAISNNGEKQPLDYSAQAYLTADPKQTLLPVDDTGTIYVEEISPGESITIIHQDLQCVITPVIPVPEDPDEIPEVGPYICER